MNGKLTKQRTRAILAGVLMVFFASSLEQTVVGTASRTIGDHLHGISLQSWVTTGFLISSTLSITVYSKLSDKFGRRPLILFATAIFTVASLGCALVGDMYQLTVARAFQGLGAGGLMVLPLAIMGDIFSPRKRAKYQVFFLTVFAVSSSLGPLIGGLFAGIPQLLWLDGWRWVFLINVPIGAISWVILWFSLRLPKHHNQARVDWVGIIFVIITLTPALFIIEFAPGWQITAAGLTLAALGLIGFIINERRMGDDALLPLKIFRIQNFALLSVMGVLVGFVFFSILVTLPMILQINFSMTATESGLAMLAMVGGMMLASMVSGQIISRSGVIRRFPVLGAFFAVISALILVTVHYLSPLVIILVALLFLGMGLGIMMQTITLASQSLLPVKFLGVASGSSIFFRQVGGTMGLSVSFSVLFSLLPQTIRHSFDNPQTKADFARAIAEGKAAHTPEVQYAVTGDFAALGKTLQRSTEFLNGLDPRLAAPFRDGFAQAAAAGYWASLIGALLLLVLSLFIKRIYLSEKSGLELDAEQNDLPVMAVTNAIPIIRQSAEGSIRDGSRPMGAQRDEAEQHRNETPGA